ncbi:MAG: FliA/WhiG family RNA polymerase sigma factor [Phycisphaerae bacterium]
MSRFPNVRLRRVSRDPAVQTFESPRELKSAWTQFLKDHDEDVRNRLMEHYLFLVRYAAERIGAKLPDEVDVDDLMSSGIFGLMDAIDNFDPARGVKFETYCAPRIRGAILDELRSMDWVPRLVRHRAQKLMEAKRTLEVELGRIPTEDELSKKLRLAPGDFEKLIRDANAVSLVSLSKKFNDSDSSRDVFELDVTPNAHDSDPVMDAQKQDVRDLVTKGLSRAERLIIVLYYYEQMTMKQIGQTLDLSESRVSQMHSAILQRLRDQLHNRKQELMPTLEEEAGTYPHLRADFPFQNGIAV